MIKYIHKIKHISKWESENKRFFDEFLFSKIGLLFCPKILMLGINPSAKQNQFCDSTNLKLINALLKFNETSPKKFKGYILTNFSSKVDSQWKQLSVADYDFELKVLEKWLGMNRPICLFYGPYFINSSSKDIKNTIFTNKFRSLIEEYRENIFITTYNGKFVHPSHNPTVEIEKYNPDEHTIYPIK